MQGGGLRGARGGVCAATLCSHHWPGVQPAGEELLLTDGRLAELAKGCVRSLESWEELVELYRGLGMHRKVGR